MLVDTAKAADYLDEHGWTRRSWRSAEGCCVVGAIIVTHPQIDINRFDYLQDEDEYAKAVRLRSEVISVLDQLTPRNNVLAWNDIDCNSKKEAVDFLRSIPPFEVE